ncbi:hypothetical protein BDV96DRAFT_569486 [Lophiotrema nucula]|uniref:Uncharacterized protein n=1 Tax=Lophiotrema nucula TaxID=690887 RepID=A0A6A5ZFG3_9PLEO|nr:hypothetical protein BDV96DRAFT_569486 [Lophiotrema nucula]
MHVFVPGTLAYSNLFAAKYLSRIQLASDPSEETLNQLLFGSPGLDRTFVTYSCNMTIVFDKLEDAHGRHYQAVRQMLKEHGLAINERKTTSRLTQPLQRGFVIEKFGGNAVAVFDAT